MKLFDVEQLRLMVEQHGWGELLVPMHDQVGFIPANRSQDFYSGCSVGFFFAWGEHKTPVDEIFCAVCLAQVSDLLLSVEEAKIATPGAEIAQLFQAMERDKVAPATEKTRPAILAAIPKGQSMEFTAGLAFALNAARERVKHPVTELVLAAYLAVVVELLPRPTPCE